LQLSLQAVSPETFGDTFVYTYAPQSAFCYSLSANRSAGVITFDSTAMVRIPLDESSTSNFLTTLANLPYRGGGTDILAALNEAINEIRDHAVHKPTLVCK